MLDFCQQQPAKGQYSAIANILRHVGPTVGALDNPNALNRPPVFSRYSPVQTAARLNSLLVGYGDQEANKACIAASLVLLPSPY